MRRLIPSLLLIATLCPAATYYVSFALGDDTRTAVQAQDPATPWKHHPDSNLATGASAAKKSTYANGDVVVMRKGEIWWDTKLTSAKAGGAGAPITTTTAAGFGTGANPIISGAALLSGAWTDTGVNGEFSIALTTQPLQVWNGDTKLTSGTPGALVANGFGWAANVLYVKIGADPTGGSIQAAQRNALSVVHAYRTYSNLDLRYSNDVTGGVVYGVNADNMVLRDSWVTRGNTYTVRCHPCTNSTLSGNTLRGTTATGIAITSTSTTNVISRNDFAFWNGAQYGAGGAGAAMYLADGAAGNTISENHFHDGYVDLNLKESSGAGANIVSRNIFRRPHVNAIQACTGGTTVAASIITGNIIIHRPTAGDPVGSVGHGVVICDAATHGQNTTRTDIQHNIFIGETSGAEMVSIDTAATVTMANVTLDYNYYWQRSSGSAWRKFDLSGTNTTDWATWVATLVAAGVTGAEAHGLQAAAAGSPFAVNLRSATSLGW